MSLSKRIDISRSFIRNSSRPTTSVRRRCRRRQRLLSFLLSCSFFRSRGLDAAWEPAYEWGASLRDVTRRVHVEGVGTGGGWSAGMSEEWVAGWTVRRWAMCEEGRDGRVHDATY